jgi:hypothetical protein
MEVSEVRRRVRAAIDSARKRAQERRARSDQAARDYEQFLRERAVPVFQTLASALVAEGHRFKVFTPADAVRLASESSADDFIELTLDTTVDPPDRPIKEQADIPDITDEDVLNLLVEEIQPFVER